MLVADSDVLIAFLRGAEPMAAQVEFELRQGWLATTAVSAFEKWRGRAARGKNWRSRTCLPPCMSCRSGARQRVGPASCTWNSVSAARRLAWRIA